MHKVISQQWKLNISLGLEDETLFHDGDVYIHMFACVCVGPDKLEKDRPSLPEVLNSLEIQGSY